MLFGLKNADATYQRLLNFIFKYQIGKNVEVYVDDIVVKSYNIEHYFEDLDRFLKILDHYQIKLNLKKCIFGVKARKFLDFMILHKGIEANSKKMEAILNMKAPIIWNEL